MAEDTGPAGSEPAGGAAGDGEEAPERARLLVTRRHFLVGAAAGAVTAGVAVGAVAVATRPSAGLTAAAPPGGAPPGTSAPASGPASAPAGAAPVAAGAIPATMRRVSLNIDSKSYDVVVDNRESLWETMNYQLGLSNSNLGCDRAQCGACTVLVDGKTVNGCTVLSARLGRGQKIMTVASLAKTTDSVAGLHPIQQAFWQDGGFQCGICTRGFIMSTYALLQAVPNPTDAQIADGLAGNICRCGEYKKIFAAVHTAAASMQGQKVTYLAPVTVVGPRKSAAPAGGAAAGVSKSFDFATPLATIEEFDPLAGQIKGKDGILAVSGSERTITIQWDPAKLDETKVRQILSDAGHPVK